MSSTWSATRFRGGTPVAARAANPRPPSPPPHPPFVGRGPGRPCLPLFPFTNKPTATTLAPKFFLGALFPAHLLGGGAFWWAGGALGGGGGGPAAAAQVPATKTSSRPGR